MHHLESHIRAAENKIVKNILLLYRAKQLLLMQVLLKFLLHIFIHILTTQTLPG